MSIRILIADDHKIVRDGLHILIDRQIDMEVIGEAKNGQEAVELTKKLRPDVVIMDISMPDMNGIDATRLISEENCDVKIIALSMHSDRRFVVGMLEAGASGYLLKDRAFSELAGAIRLISENNSYMSPEISDFVVWDHLKNGSGKDEQDRPR